MEKYLTEKKFLEDQEISVQNVQSMFFAKFQDVFQDIGILKAIGGLGNLAVGRKIAILKATYSQKPCF